MNFFLKKTALKVLLRSWLAVYIYVPGGVGERYKKMGSIKELEMDIKRTGSPI